MLLKALREGLGRLIVFINFVTRPRPMQRSQEAQARVNDEASSLTLYQFYACPFCVRTRRAIHRLNLPIETRDAQNNPIDRQALKDGGGEIKVPCLRIEEAGETRWMYESMDIINYLDERFGTQA
jgi:glutaredoxin